jgi:transposase
MPGTLEFAIHTLVEKRLDMSIFEGKYCNDETGRTAYDPKILLKVVLLAYSQGLISSRKIEQACRENVVFIALACGQQPDHSTIAAFVSSMKDEILPLFRDMLLICVEMNLLGGTMFALDGCKLPQRLERVERHFPRTPEEEAEDRGQGGAVAGRTDANRPRAG